MFTVIDPITALCAYIFQNYWKNIVNYSIPNKGSL